MFFGNDILLDEVFNLLFYFYLLKIRNIP